MSSLNQNVIRHKIGLLNLATELGDVSKACKVMGLSRDTFYRYQNAVAEGGIEALFESNRRKPNPKNRVEEATETAVLAYATEQPAHGQVRTSNELRQRGIFVSPSGVRSIWLRNDLASFKQRLAALEKQADLDAWLTYHNNARTHQGKMCCGRTPVQTLIAGKEAWNEKVASLNLI